jgi:hypothetical protein
MGDGGWQGEMVIGDLVIWWIGDGKARLEIAISNLPNGHRPSPISHHPLPSPITNLPSPIESYW